jgi:hypothetical protein
MVDPDLTLPATFGDPQFERFLESKLDDRFADQAEARMQACLDGCRCVMEHGSGTEAANLLAFDLAKAAAHWRRLAEDRRTGELIIVDGVELVEAP